jgi:hypothetical protein
MTIAATPQESPKPFTGFLSFTPSPSPFARKKSPPPMGTAPKLGAAFGSYTASAVRFGSPSAEAGKKKRGPNDNEPSFGDILAGDKGDDEEEKDTKPVIEEVDRELPCSPIQLLDFLTHAFRHYW